MNTLESIDFLDEEAAKASELAEGIARIGRDATEFKQRADRLRDCKQKLVALNEILSSLTQSPAAYEYVYRPTARRGAVATH
jgi:Tfp pilus assembly protein PilN